MLSPEGKKVQVIQFTACEGGYYSSTPDKSKILLRFEVFGRKHEEEGIFLEMPRAEKASGSSPTIQHLKYCFRSLQIMTLFNFANFFAYQIIAFPGNGTIFT